MTAYDMRIRYWSSDVCSSDLREDCEIAVKIICGFSQFNIFGEDTGHRHWIVAVKFQRELIESCVDFISDLLQASDRHHVGVSREPALLCHAGDCSAAGCDHKRKLGKQGQDALTRSNGFRPSKVPVELE